jgi:hypothetical protein
MLLKTEIKDCGTGVKGHMSNGCFFATIIEKVGNLDIAFLKRSIKGGPKYGVMVDTEDHEEFIKRFCELCNIGVVIYSGQKGMINTDFCCVFNQMAPIVVHIYHENYHYQLIEKMITCF